MPNIPFDNTAEDMLAQRAIPPQAQIDFLAISELSADACEEIVAALESLSASDDRLPQEAIAEVLGEGHDELVGAILRLNVSIEPDQLDTTFHTLNRWVEGSPERQTVFTQERLQRLYENAAMIARPFDAIVLNEKAGKVIRATGNELLRISSYCDLRPVFDDAREHVDAFVLLANLRIEYLTQSSDKQVFELALTEDELRQVSIEIGRALEKVDRLKPIGSRILNPSTEKEA